MLILYRGFPFANSISSDKILGGVFAAVVVVVVIIGTLGKIFRRTDQS